ncbi:MAG: sporulation protein YabP [Lachnospiraceae bacterium]
MEKNEMKPVPSHNITVRDRREINLTGVLDVKSFDELEVLLETELGMLLIKGKGLAVKNLSLEQGIVQLEGEPAALVYTRQEVKKNKESLAKRLFS